MVQSASSRPDRAFQRTGKTRLYVMEPGPENHKLLVPEALVQDRVKLLEVRPNSTVSWLGHLADEVLIQIDQQFSRALPAGRPSYFKRPRGRSARCLEANSCGPAHIRLARTRNPYEDNGAAFVALPDRAREGVHGRRERDGAT